MGCKDCKWGHPDTCRLCMIGRKQARDRANAACITPPFDIENNPLVKR
jgi:hypothetical protein